MKSNVVYSNLTEHQLQAVLALGRHGSFTAAAADLGLSQPVLTRRIAALEAMIGAPAFDRTTRSVRLTPVGRELVGVASRVLEDIRLARDRLSEIAAAGHRQIAATSLTSLAATVVPPAAARFLARHPGIEIIVREGGHDAVVADVESGAADCGIAYVDGLPPGLRGEPLRTEHYALVVRAGHALAGRRSVGLCDVAAEPLAGFPPETQLRRLIDSAARDRGLRLRYAVQTCGYASALAHVAAGVASTIAPVAAVRPRPPDGLVAIPLDEPDLVRDVGIVTAADREPHGLAAAFLCDLRAAFRAGPDAGGAMRGHARSAGGG